MEALQQLFHLQEVDAELGEKEAGLAQVEQQIADDQELHLARGAAAQGKEVLAHLEQEQRWQERRVEDLKSKITPLDRKLYSGQITNPKELVSLQQDIEMLKRQNKQEEEKLLELWSKVDATRLDLNQRNRHLEEVEAGWRQLQHDLGQQREELLLRIGELSQRRTALSQRLDTNYLRVYEEVRKVRRPVLARIEQGRCRGCQLALSLAEIQRARTGLVQCSSCQRILFAPN